jgi:hypothetical protein
LPDCHKGQENKELTETPETSLQTSLQKNSENSPKSTDSIPDDLAKISAAWPSLPSHIKAAIKIMVETFGAGSK